MIVVAVPVKDLVTAKRRLTPILSPDERRDLTRAMLRDVLRVLATTRLDLVWVITRDAEVSTIARALGAEVLAETANRGHTAAVAFAQQEAIRRGAGLFVTVPGDVPCATADEINALAHAATERTPAAVLTPSRSGRGTNGAALAPPQAMPLTFGEPSFDNHLRLASRLDLAPRILRLPGLGLDIDGPEDLKSLLTEGDATESGRLLARWDIASRLTADASRAGFARAISGGRDRKGGEAPLRG